MLSEVALQMCTHSIDGEVISFVFKGCSVVINKRTREHRHYAVIAQAALNNAFLDSDTFNVPVLSSLKNIKLVKSRAFEFSCFQCDIKSEYI